MGPTTKIPRELKMHAHETAMHVAWECAQTGQLRVKSHQAGCLVHGVRGGKEYRWKGHGPCLDGVTMCSELRSAPVSEAREEGRARGREGERRSESWWWEQQQPWGARWQGGGTEKYLRLGTEGWPRAYESPPGILRNPEGGPWTSGSHSMWLIKK